MVNVFNQVKTIFIKPSIATDEIDDKPELESEESAEQRKTEQGQGVKILIPKQMTSRLPISLAQIKAGNNSGKLKKMK